MLPALLAAGRGAAAARGGLTLSEGMDIAGAASSLKGSSPVNSAAQAAASAAAANTFDASGFPKYSMNSPYSGDE